MSGITRRNFLGAGAALAAGSTLFKPRWASAQELRFTPEPGAELRVLRW